MDKEMSTSEEKEGEMGIPFFMKIWIDSQQYCSTTDDFIVLDASKHSCYTSKKHSRTQKSMRESSYVYNSILRV
jgi:hypothetical protein